MKRTSYIYSECLNSDKKPEIRLAGLELELDGILVEYGSKFLELDQKYPFGTFDRAEEFKAHRRKAIKDIAYVIKSLIAQSKEKPEITKRSQDRLQSILESV